MKKLCRNLHVQTKLWTSMKLVETDFLKRFCIQIIFVNFFFIWFERNYEHNPLNENSKARNILRWLLVKTCTTEEEKSNKNSRKYVIECLTSFMTTFCLGSKRTRTKLRSCEAIEKDMWTYERYVKDIFVILRLAWNMCLILILKSFFVAPTFHPH